LGQLIDQIHTANIPLSRLNDIVDIKEFAEHWTITLDFLNLVLGQLWPEYLANEGLIDPALARRLHIEKLTQYYKENPPKKPIFVAGSTGSLPATQDFIKTISYCDQGYVFLPAFDPMMNANEWIKVDEGHPQYHLQNLLQACECTPENVEIYAEDKMHKAQQFTISQIMRPAAITNEWQALINQNDRQKIGSGLKNITQIACSNEDEEARVIALSMAEIAADKNQKKTCSLITPDRILASRVQSHLSQWGIVVDDSAGVQLNITAIGRYCLCIAGMEDKGTIEPISFLAALKNKYAGGGDLSPYFRSTLRQFENDCLRGVRPPSSIANLNGDKHQEFIQSLSLMVEPLTELGQELHPLSTWINAHLNVMENIASTQNESGAERLWIGPDGEALADLFENLQIYSSLTPNINLSDYKELLSIFMQSVSVRPPYGGHPRLSILGQIESRMIRTDRIILAGLNEGTWPPESGFDAFLSRPMRGNFGLPSVDHKISLAAHDFATALGGHDVFITYSERKGGSPALPSRWIQRLETLISAVNGNDATDKHPVIENPNMRGVIYKHWASKLRHMDIKSQSIDRPAPRPPIERRPKILSVTDIEKWMRDPYFIYAKRILDLHKIDPVNMDVTARDKGNLIHQTMENFTRDFPHLLPNAPLETLIQYGRDVFDTQSDTPEIYGLWWPRFVRAAEWVVRHEKQWRQDTRNIISEDECEFKIEIAKSHYTLKGKADRIDIRRDGSYAIIDYKTGGVPSKANINLGIGNQLPIEGYILQEGQFNSVDPIPDTAISMHYWKLNGSGEGGEATDIETTKGKGRKIDYAELITEAKEGLHALINIYSHPETPYMATPDQSIALEYNDYDHLERTREWLIRNGGKI
jgi:ATP-dependent helicase/nuclease subunit B